MTLEDLLVSYKQVQPEPSYKKPEIPVNRYNRVISFRNSQSDKPAQEETTQEQPIVVEWTYNAPPQQSTVSQGKFEFDKAFDEVIKTNSEASQWRDFLTEVAKRESNFNPTIQYKAGAPAWGYFQFMQSEDGKYNNIKHYAGTDVQTFLNNPQLQINAAIKLVNEFKNSITQADKIKAKSKGLDLNTQKGMNAALHAMWLGGPGGFRKWLKGENVSDRHWSDSGAGISVDELIKKYNS